MPDTAKKLYKLYRALVLPRCEWWKNGACSLPKKCASPWVSSCQQCDEGYHSFVEDDEWLND